MSKFWSTSDSDSDSDDNASSNSSQEEEEEDSVDWGDSEDDDADDEDKDNNDTVLEDIEDPFSSFGIGSLVDRTTQSKESKNTETFSAKAALETTKDPNTDANLLWEKIKDEQLFAEVPTTNTRLPDSIRIVMISDTHSKHRDIPFLPKGDVLIHGGDFTKSGEIGSVQDLSRYFADHQNQFEKIICIAGNHELTFHTDFYPTAKRKHKSKPFDPEESRAALTNCIYLEDSTTIIGKDESPVQVYGSPWTPAFYDWAFNLPRGEALDQIWKKVPASTDVLITHGPPLGRGDFTDHSGRSGDYDLLQHVQNRVRPRLHVFGHIHQAHGYSFDGQTLFCNASSLDSDTEIASRPCIVVDLPYDKALPARIVKPSCAIQTLEALLVWLEQNNYKEILRCAPRTDLTRPVTIPDAFSSESSFFDLCGILGLYRDKAAREELRTAVCQLYAESFV